jgi:hypothetical protein
MKGKKRRKKRDERGGGAVVPARRQYYVYVCVIHVNDVASLGARGGRSRSSRSSPVPAVIPPCRPLLTSGKIVKNKAADCSLIKTKYSIFSVFNTSRKANRDLDSF